MGPPLVTVLIPTYEPKGEYLRAALTSLQRQSYPRWNAIIRDDASQVETENIVEPFLHDARFTFIRGNHRRGIGGNWNACLRCAGDASFVQFLFQDDLWDAGYLQRSVQEMLADPAIGFVTTLHRYQVEGSPAFTKNLRAFYGEIERAQREVGGGKHGSRVFLRAWVRRGLRPNLIGEPSFVLLRRSLVEQVGMFSPHLRQVLDIEYWVRCLRASECFSVVTAAGGSFRVHAHAATARNDDAWRRLSEKLVFGSRHPLISMQAAFARQEKLR